MLTNVLVSLLLVRTLSSQEPKGTWNHWQVPHTATGDIEYVRIKPKAFGGTRYLRVLLPPGYRTSFKRYPVLYMNDGQDLFDKATATFFPEEWGLDKTVPALIKANKVEPFIVVGIDNPGYAGRSHEYLIWPKDVGEEGPAPVGAKHPDFLCKEVIPTIEKRFRVKPGAANRVLGGDSLGGGLALYIAMKRPRMFSGLLVESPAVYPSDYRLLEEMQTATQWPDRIYLGCGDSDDDMIDDALRLKHILGDLGFTGKRLKVLFQEGGKHNCDWWARRFPTAAQFLFPPKN